MHNQFFVLIKRGKNLRKVGIIELQTTSARLIIADVLENQSFIITDKYENGIKAAADLANFELIKPTCIASISSVLKTYKAILAASQVSEIYAIASCEYFDAKNQRSLFEELYSTTSFRFKLLTQEEQSNNLYLAFINSLDCPKGLALGVNGANVQILAYNRRNTLNQATVNCGAVSLAEMFAEKNLAPESAMKEMTNEFSKQISSIDWFKGLDSETQIVGAGDVFLSIAKLSKKLKHYPYSREHSYQFSLDDLNKVYDFVKTLDIDKTKKLKGISNQRADALASGISIVKAVAEKSKIDKFIVSSYGVAEGYLLGIVNQACLEKPLSDILGNSLETLDMYYNNANIKNTQNIYDISLILFKQLKVLHKLPRNYVKVLRIASYMHDVGKRISYIDYEKKGFNVVLDSEIYGVNHHEQVLASFVVACQKLDDFSMTDWVKYSSMLSETDLDGVRKLAVIVRLASLLDMFGSGRIKDISCDILGDSVIMKTIVDAPVDMEIAEALKVSGDFAKAFKKHLEIL